MDKKGRKGLLKKLIMMNFGVVQGSRERVARYPGAPVMLVLLAIFVFSMLLDAVATQFLVSRGLVAEGNPAMALLIGKGQFAAFKVLGATICSGLLWMVYRRFPRLSLFGVLSSLLVCTVILLWNTAGYPTRSVIQAIRE